MTPERWERLKQIVADALDLDGAQRDPFLDRACAGDADLRAEAASLLAAEDPAGRFLEPDPPPERIGAYRIIREIGRGGMGTVYEGARADAQFEQRVAIKIVKRGMDTDAVLRRFYGERQVLARLQHPNIARLFDGGVTPDGRPYFVMECLDARPITDYCAERTLSADARIDLLITVCDAVEYAHSHLVLHRDLKPANIVVDASGTPKLLDFGIAKLLDETDASGLVTEAGQRVMTPLYASPEQRSGDTLTTASDVYALGLLLREIVPDAAARGDLDRIARKALEQEPPRRYQRAGDLADDLRRYRRHLPVTARPSGLAYRASKFMARHWRGLAAAAAVAIIVSVAIVNALIAGRRADRHFREVRQLANSFLFEFHDAIATLPGATPARELVLTRAVQYLDSLSREAANDIDLKRELAASYERVAEAQGLYYEANLGKNAEAQASFEKSIALLKDVVRARPSDVGAQADLANATIGLGTMFQSSPRGLALFEEAIAQIGTTRGLMPLESRLELMLGNAYQGVAEFQASHNVPASLEARKQAIAIYSGLAQRAPADANSERHLSISFKRRAALYLTAMHDAGKAKADLDAARAIDERHLALDPASAVYKLDLALGDSYRSTVLRQMSDLPGALDALTRAMTLRREILRADPQNVRVRGLLASDDARLTALTALLKKSGDAALLRRAEALAAPR